MSNIISIEKARTKKARKATKASKVKNMKPSVEARIDRIIRSLDAIEIGRYHEFSMQECADYIAWVAAFHKAPRSTWEPIAERITELFKSGHTD